MPLSLKEKIIYTFLTVFLTVNAFAFYCLSIEMGGMSTKVVYAAYSISTWIFPIPIVLLEIVIAFLLAFFVCNPIALKWTFKNLSPKKDALDVIQNKITISMVYLMCPLMTLIAIVLYDVIPNQEFNEEFFSKFLQSFVLNFPFALITQIYFIQPFVRKVFTYVFQKKQGNE